MTRPNPRDPPVITTTRSANEIAWRARASRSAHHAAPSPAPAARREILVWEPFVTSVLQQCAQRERVSRGVPADVIVEIRVHVAALVAPRPQPARPAAKALPRARPAVL